MKKSKYLNQKFNGWTCVKVKPTYVQSVFYKGTKEVSKRPYHQTYVYTMEATLLGQTVQVTLNHREAAKMYRGKFDPILKVLLGQNKVCVAIR